MSNPAQDPSFPSPFSFGEMSSFMESKAAFDARLKEINLADLKDWGQKLVKCHNL